MSKTTLTITREYLASKSCCDTYLLRFEQLFPDGVEVTPDRAAEVAEDFDWDWAILTLLIGDAHSQAKLAMMAAEDEREDALRLARETLEQSGGIWFETARVAFSTTVARADDAFEIEQARIFARYFIEQGGRELLEGEAQIALSETRTLKITKEYLNAKCTCYEQMNTFERLFPEGVEVTEEAVLTHVETFDWTWAIDQILEGENRTRALEHDKWLFSLCGHIRDALWQDFNAETAHTTAERALHLDQIRQAKAHYFRRSALIFARAFIKQDGRKLLPGEEAE